MTTTTSRRLANAIVVATLVLLTASAGFELLHRGIAGKDVFNVIYIPLTFLGASIYLWVGRMIVARQPSNTVGWILLAIPLIASFALANGAYATQALVASPGSLPAGRFSAWVDRWMIVPMLAAFIPIFLLFPNGHLPSRRWRPVLWLAVAAPAVTTTAFALTPGRMTGAMANLQTVRVTNPFGLDTGGGAIQTLTQIGGIATFVGAIGAGAAIAVRYRGADGETRQQVRWLAFVALAFFVEIVIGFVGIAITHDSDLFGNILFLAWSITLIVGIPVACGIAILKYHLYDLDVVVRKTVVFAVLAAFIAAVYAIVVGGVGALVGSRSNTLLSFAAAALLAVAFQPARDRARRVADRVVYGKRATPYEVLVDFSSRLGETDATESVLSRMAQILGAGTGATSARVWLRVGSQLRPGASWGGVSEPGALELGENELPPIPGEHAVEVRHRGELLGALSIIATASDPVTPAKDKLVRDLASQAGLVLRNVRLIEELRASRQRLVAAQDAERRRIERNIHDGAQQQIVALAVKLRLTGQLAPRDATKAKELLRQLQGETSEALQTLRDLASGIYPPVLTDSGLEAALRAQVRTAPFPVDVLAEGLDRYPPEAEATAYFCALEALQNVAKYADASRATITLSDGDGVLRFQVADDGKGFDPSSTGYGTGLQGMADRLAAAGGALHVESAPGSGTIVTGRVPVPILWETP